MKRSLRLLRGRRELARCSPARLRAPPASPGRSAAPQTTQECNKVKVCVHVVGPWVAVPATGEATLLLECPKRQGSRRRHRCPGELDQRSRLVRRPDRRADQPEESRPALSCSSMRSRTTDKAGCVPAAARLHRRSRSRAAAARRSRRAALGSGCPGRRSALPLDPQATIVVSRRDRSRRRAGLPEGETLVGSWNAARVQHDRRRRRLRRDSGAVTDRRLGRRRNRCTA